MSMSTLIVLIGETPDMPWTWALSAPDQQGTAQNFEEKIQLADLKASALTVIVPGTQITIKAHDLQNLSDKQKRQAAGFSIEDELASPLDTTHFAFDPRLGRMAIVSTEITQSILDSFQDIGLAPDHIYADFDSFKDDFISYKDRILVCQEDGLGFAVEESLAAQILDKSQNTPRRLTAQEFLKAVQNSLDAGHTPINIRQGAFAKHGSVSAKHKRRIALLAASIALVFGALNIGQGLAYKHKTNAANETIKTIYTQVFPDQTIPKNPVLPLLRMQVDRKAGAEDPFLTLSSILAASVKAVDGVEISALKYDQSTRQLTLSVSYNGFDSVEGLKLAVQKNGGVFKEGGTRKTENGLSGDAILSGASQ